ASGSLDELDLAAVALGDLAHYRQSQTRSLPAAGGLRTVEAVEDEGPVARVDPGAVVADQHLAARCGHLHHPARLAPLGGVLHQVPDRAIQLLRVADHGGGLAIVVERELREAG